MSLASLRAAAARLLTDARYRERFYAFPESSHETFGLTRDEYRSMRRIDRRHLDIVSEGYAGKRFERVESAFPRTLALLDAVDRGVRAAYLGATAFPADEARERDTFVSFVRSLDAPAPLQRFLNDLVDLERALYDAPRPDALPSYRYRPERTRPRRTGFASTVRFRGPLPSMLNVAAPPPLYPEAAGTWLVLREGDELAFESLEGSLGALWEACDGSRTVSDLVEAFGASAEATIQGWLRLQVVEDAAGPD